jgi:hypothetical protein
VAYAIDLVAFNEVYPDTLRETAYMKCFTRVVLDIARNAERFNASNSERSPTLSTRSTTGEKPKLALFARVAHSWRSPVGLQLH